MQRRFSFTRAKNTPAPNGEPPGGSTSRIYTLNSITAAIDNELDLDAILQHALRWGLTVTEVDAANISLWDQHADRLVLAASTGTSEESLGDHIRPEATDELADRALRTGKPVVVNDLSADGDGHSHGAGSCAAIPLLADGRAVGVMSLLSRERGKFTRTDVGVMQSIGQHVGAAILRAQNRSESASEREQLGQKMNQLSELIKVSASFRASAPLEQVLDAICSAIRTSLGFRMVELSLLDPETGLMVPTVFAGFTPEQQEEIRRFTRPAEFYSQVMQPKYRISNSYFIPHYDTPYSGEDWAFVPDIDDSERAEDEWHSLDSLAVPLHNREGQLIGILYVDDPVERKLPTLEQIQVLEMFVQQAALAIENHTLLQELRKSEAKYRLLTENASDLIFLLEPDGRISFLSSSAKRVLGYDPEELIGQKFSDLLSPTSRRLSPNYLLSPDQTQELQGRCEVEIIRKDGSSRFLEINSTPVFENGRLVGEQGIARDVSEKKRMEREIAQRQRQLRRSQKRQEQLTGYAATVIAAQEDERRRIARDLHDDTAQALIALSRHIEALHHVLEQNPDEAQGKLHDLKKLTDQTLASVRRFSRDLRPSLLDDLGLVPALEWLVSENANRNHITTRLKVSGDERRLPPEVELACFRIAQEALNNAAKHAQATGAAVEMHFGDAWCRLTISDNGIGFESPPVISDLAGKGRMGVMGMQERANLLGGTLTLRTAPGQGTRVTVTIPLPADS